MPGRCHFNEKWPEKDAYKSWLRKDDKNSNKAFCFACNKSIDLNVMGKSALLSHTKDKKHEEYIKKSSRQWEDLENIDVNRNIFLGFEVKLSLKKSLKFQSRVLESPWKVLEFLAWKSVRNLTVEAPQRTSLHLVNIVSCALLLQGGRIPCPVDRNLEIFSTSHIDFFVHFWTMWR